MAIIVLLQNDLRLKDNPALFYAVQQEAPIIPVYLLKPNLGAASRAWLMQSLKSFAEDLNKDQIPLFYHEGTVAELIEKLNPKIQIDAIYSNFYVKEAKVFYPNLLFPPNEINKTFKLFAPFWRFCKQLPHLPARPLGKPLFKNTHLLKPIDLKSIAIPKWSAPHWWPKIAAHWQIGEQSAQQKWRDFYEDQLEHYATERDIPGPHNTSTLSPHLHFGEISVRQLWQDIHKNARTASHAKFLDELGWREFAYHLHYHHPLLRTDPLNQKYLNFKWENNIEFLERWKKGTTGFPIVDAGMRQLWQTGWMHNRVRMLTASFLTKNGLIPWQEGERWFFDTLVDADAAINATNWQWVAGCGTDSAPYFRIFNPTLQAKKFDPEGSYIRQWVPELKDVPNKTIHEPWLTKQLAPNYPEPMIDLLITRRIALEAFYALK
jgi:deoxyribodipyrimidine photo-lyase